MSRKKKVTKEWPDNPMLVPVQNGIINLHADLTKHQSAILNWSLQGLADLLEEGVF